MPEENKPAPSGSLFNFSFSDIFGAGKGVEKLAATVGGGAGRVADGIGVVADVKWLDKVKADNEAYRVQVVGDAQTRVMANRAREVAALAREGQHLQGMSIVEGGITAQLVGTSLETRELHERTLRRMMYENAMQQLNRETVTAHAAAELAGNDEVSDEPVEADWTTHYYKFAQDVSSDEMQVLWGRVLAGEIRKPGSFSPRTLQFIALLTQNEAKLFQRLCAFTWRDIKGEPHAIVVAEDEGKLPASFQYLELQLLQSIGLIEFNFLGGYIFSGSTVELSYNGSTIELFKPKHIVKDHIEAGQVNLTQMGIELTSICTPEYDWCIMEEAMAHWMARGYQVSCPFEIQPPKPPDIQVQ